MTYRSPALLLGFGGLVGHRDQHVLDLDGSPAFYLGATLSFDLGRVIGPSRWGLVPRQWARRCDSPAARETPPAHDPIRTTAQAQGKACEHKKTQGCHKGECFTLEVFATTSLSTKAQLALGLGLVVPQRTTINTKQRIPPEV